MSSERLKITVEFSKANVEELKLYAALREFSNSGAIIKDILKGKLPVAIIGGYEDAK